MDDAKKHALGLRISTGYNNQHFFQLIKSFGSISEAWKAGPPSIRKAAKAIRGFDADDFVELRKRTDLDKMVDALEKRSIDIVVYNTPDYPELLTGITSPPPMLFTRGAGLDKLHGLCVAIIGARRATGYGRMMAETIANELGKQNITVVSGLARGIDTAAHKGALSTPGGTVAVLGCGLDICYPPENHRLFEDITACGVLISEYPLGVAPLAKHFPARNRIISGLCEAVVVVEANVKSGAMITADFALEYGREVFAVPGSVRSLLSHGPHRLLKEGASLIESAQDILLELGILAESVEEEKKVDISLLGEDEQSVLEHVGFELTHIDDITTASGYPVAHVAGILTMLELKGYLQQDQGKYFQKT